VVETPEQRVARLEAELAQAKVDALQKQLADAQARVQGQPGGVPQATWIPTLPPQQELINQLRSAQPQFGGVLFGKSSPPPDTNLATAPRAVPSAYRLVAFPFSFWTLFALFMIAISPIALWIFVPIAGVIVAGVTFVAVVVISLRRSALRNSLLKWGEVARIISPDVKSVGTYYSGTTVQNVRIAQAHGWTVERRWYSGPVTKTVINYELRGTQASVTIRGLPYDNGVILADSRDPQRALCVSSFPYDLERDASGNWTGRIAARTKVGAIVMIDLLLIWTAAMVFLCGLGANLW
jgi:hypothetical protein